MVSARFIDAMEFFFPYSEDIFTACATMRLTSDVVLSPSLVYSLADSTVYYLPAVLQFFLVLGKDSVFAFSLVATPP